MQPPSPMTGVAIGYKTLEHYNSERGVKEPGPAHKAPITASRGQFPEAWVGRSLSVTPHFGKGACCGDVRLSLKGLPTIPQSQMEKLLESQASGL